MKNIFALAALFFLTLSVAAQDVNQMDAKGLRHGLWKGIYDDTKLPRYEGTFNHGKETGTFKFFENAKASPLVATRVFAADGSCYTTFFDAKGLKTGEGKEVNKLYEGEWRFYHPNSTALLSVEKYVKGKIVGIRKVFYPNKAIGEETAYVNGVKEGIYKKYTEKGILLEDALYKNGEFHGPVTYRNQQGEIVATGQFKNGKKAGMWKYFEKGKLVKEEDKSIVRKPERKQ
jgi:antitoxin component YwqK of YwqJK toxin-antitoxin module